MKKTKIIATVWPVSSSSEAIKQLYDSWVNILRLNFSHARYDETQKIIDRVNNLNDSWKTNLSLLLDTKGPEIRTWTVEKDIKVGLWDILHVCTIESKCSWNDIFCDYKHLSDDVKIWGSIIIDSWLLNVEVISKKTFWVEVRALNAASIWSRRHVNLPGVKLQMPWITAKDKEDILWGIQHWISFVAASFIRNKSNVLEVRKLLDEHWWKDIKIISKVENQEAIDNIDDIIMESDGTMVARWDLGIEVPIKKLAVYQKEMVEKSNMNGKFVITATHLLETMIDHPFPTRAESSDVFNAVLQEPDCLMLSWETAIWKFPVESVKMMTSIIEEAEDNHIYNHQDYSSTSLTPRDIEKKLLIRSWIFISEDLQIQALLIFTKSWKLAKLASSYRPTVKTYAFTPNIRSVKTCNAYYWISPIHMKDWDQNNYDITLEKAINYLIHNNSLSKKDTVVAISDIQKWDKEIPVMKVIHIADFI